jgi:hypothetical protein
MASRQLARWVGSAMFGVLIVSAIWGCSGPACVVVMDRKAPERDADLIKTTQNAVDGLVLRPNPGCVTRHTCARVIVATPVNLDDLSETSTFGRLLGEIIAGRMAHWKFTVVQMYLRQGDVRIREDGAFSLSRDVNELAKNYDASLVVVGTYTVATDKIYLSLKIVSLEQNGIIGAIDVGIPKGPRTVALLSGRSSTAVAGATPRLGEADRQAYYRKW